MLMQEDDRDSLLQLREHVQQLIEEALEMDGDRVMGLPEQRDWLRFLRLWQQEIEEELEA